MGLKVMDPLQLFDWTNSLDAIKELEKLLRCTVCHKVTEESLCLGRCEHHFCQGCVKTLENGMCPSCKIPAPPCERRPDRIVRELVVSCKDLRALISGGNGRTDAEGGGAELHTPEKEKKSNPTLTDIPVEATKTSNEKDERKPPVLLTPARDKDSKSEETRGKKKTKNTPKTQANKRSMQGQATTPKVQRQEKKPKLTTPTAEAKKFPKVADLSALGMSPKSGAVNRRNTKGETPLHVACVKGDKDRVQQLLSEGACPNTKDNAGWTPLHEVSSHGFEVIADLLLRHGALVDPTAGSNETPLHDAVTHGQLAMVRLLRAWGADDAARNLSGHTPRTLAALCAGADELTAALDTPADPSLPRPAIALPLVERMTLLGADLSRPNAKRLESLARMLRAKLVTEFSAEVTHIIVECTSERLANTRSPKYMMGVAAGKWILSHTWMYECLDSESALCPDDHEVLGCVGSDSTQPGVPAVARRNSEKLRPGLFSGCHMFLWGSFPGPNGRREVEGLVRAGGGSVLAREPNAEAILEEDHKVPYHTSPSGPFATCSHYIIYSDASLQPQIKYDMKHFKSLPLSWLHRCVDTFSLPPPIK